MFKKTKFKNVNYLLQIEGFAATFHCHDSQHQLTLKIITDFVII